MPPVVGMVAFPNAGCGTTLNTGVLAGAASVFLSAKRTSPLAAPASWTLSSVSLTRVTWIGVAPVTTSAWARSPIASKARPRSE